MTADTWQKAMKAWGSVRAQCVDLQNKTYFASFLVAHFCLAKVVFLSHVSEPCTSACLPYKPQTIQPTIHQTLAPFMPVSSTIKPSQTSPVSPLHTHLI